jgi:hypothetical protein
MQKIGDINTRSKEGINIQEKGNMQSSEIVYGYWE